MPKLDSALLSEIGRDANPDSLAIATPGLAGLTYRDLRCLIRNTRETLAASGIGVTDTVATALPGGPATAALLLALVSHCRVAPLNPSLTREEAGFVLSDVGARALIAQDMSLPAVAAAGASSILILTMTASDAAPGDFALCPPSGATGSAADLREPDADSVCLLLHTSGTTSRPKLVPLTQRNLCLSAAAVARVLNLTPADRCLSVMPLFHVHGLVAGLLASIAAGATVCCTPGFRATSFFSWLDQSSATWYTAVPTMHQAILARAARNRDVVKRRTLRLIRSASAPLYPALRRGLESTFQAPVLNAYGMTEAAHQIASVPMSVDGQADNGVGFSTGPEIAIADAGGSLLPAGKRGEIVLRGAQITQGYLAPEGSNETGFRNGWFRTGDEGILAEDGCLHILGRIKEIINTGGEKVSPYEVEEALLRHPEVAEAIAFGAPHALLGEQVLAAVVLREGGAATPHELIAASNHRLAPYKRPRQILILDEIPKGPTGKPQRIGMALRLGLEADPNF